MVCKFCGYQNHQGSVYCGGCGRMLENDGRETKQKKNKKIITGLLIVMALAVASILLFGQNSASPSSGNHSQTINQQHNQGNAQQSSATQHQHSWRDATCTEPKTCDTCGERTGNAAGHQWIEATYNTPRTCMICSKEEGSKKTPSSPLGLKDIVSDTWASSVYAGDNLGKHSPDKLYDGKLNTNWTEDASGVGIEECVEFYFDHTYAINQLRIYIGSHYNESVYRHNCRPKAILLTFADATSEYIVLEDTYDEQTITFDQYYYTNFVKLTIKDVYTGTKYQDTVIAELDFTAYRP